MMALCSTQHATCQMKIKQEDVTPTPSHTHGKGVLHLSANSVDAEIPLQMELLDRPDLAECKFMSFLSWSEQKAC